MLEDREFHPKLGRLRSRERAPKLFVAQVLAAAQRAGHVGRSWPPQSSDGHKHASAGPGGAGRGRAWPRGGGEGWRCVLSGVRVVLKNPPLFAGGFFRAAD